MTNKIGVRREDKHQWERRVPFTPALVEELVGRHGVAVSVQPSEIRAFSDDAYRSAGAVVAEDLSDCDVVFAVKEIPTALFRPGGAYVFFSHTIKGQAHNMPMLRRLMELSCTLIDYERIVDDDNRRLVFFGLHAGLAGMIDTLAVTGRRLAALGTSTSLQSIELTHHYADLAEASAAVRRAGEALAIPEALAPFVIGVTGYGNVSRGAQEILDLLPMETVEVADIADIPAARDRVFKVVFKEEHLAEPIDASAQFALQHYYDHPEAYRGVFERHLPHLSILVNAIYWTSAYPRLVTKSHIPPKLVCIGDISCDIDGAVECTVKATTPGAPVFIYDPKTGAVHDGYDGPGVALMTTDCLPCELSKEASESFTDALRPFVPAIATADLGGSPDALPAPIRRAVVLWRGELTRDYRHLQQYVG